MMKTWLMAGAAVLFIGLNVYLILKEDSKIERTSYVDKQASVKAETLRETLHTRGVISPAEENYVYYDEKYGSIQKIVVAKGDSVEMGSPLYEYSPANLESTRTKLESEKAELENEVMSIDAYIEKLSAYQASLGTSETADMEVMGELGEPLVTEQESGDDSQEVLRQSAERDVYQKELEKSKLENEIMTYDQQLQSLDAEMTNLTVKSEYDGIVKSVQADLKDPMITIVSNTPAVKGNFTETERKQVTDGMKILISARDLKGPINGSLNPVSKIPAADSAAGKNSMYPFTVTLDEPSDNLLQGSHVNVTVVLNEVNGALTVPETSIVKSKKKAYVFVLSAGGKAEKRAIQPGLTVNGRQEVKKGVEKGELIVSSPSRVHEANSAFVTPMKLSQLHKKEIKKASDREKVKYLVTGLLAK